MKEGWTYKTLGDITTSMADGPFGSNLKKEHYTDKPEVRIIQLSNIGEDGWREENTKYTTFEHLKSIQRSEVQPGDIVIAKMMPAGRAILCPSHEAKFVLSSDAVRATLIQGVNRRFVLYSINSPYFRKQVYENVSGSGRVRTSLTKLKACRLLIPGIDEQERIVERLDAAFAQIDELKSNAERQLAEARALFQAALTQAMQPKPGWQEIAFKDICSFVRGPFGGSLKKECFKESGYAVYEQQNAIYNKFSFRYFIDEEKYESMKRFSVNPGDLIMSCSGTIGKVAIIPDDAKQGIINQALLKLTPSKKINNYYLKYLMESELFKELIRSYSDGAAIQNIASVSILKEILLRIPSVSEQQRIVEYNDSLTASFYEIEDNYKQTAAECDALKQALLRQIFE